MDEGHKVSNLEATMEMVLPVLVTDVMQELEKQGKHPEADFTERLRGALMHIVPLYPNIEQQVWDEDDKIPIIKDICDVIAL